MPSSQVGRAERPYGEQLRDWSASVARQGFLHVLRGSHVKLYIHRRLRETVFSSCWVIFAFKNGIYPIHLPFTYWLDLVNSTSWSSAQTLQCFEHGTHPHASFDARLPCRKWFCILSESVLPGIQNWLKQESTGNKTKRWRKLSESEQRVLITTNVEGHHNHRYR